MQHPEQDAVISAIVDVEQAGIGARVPRVEADGDLAECQRDRGAGRPQPSERCSAGPG
ncbi:MAG: hypothetical protein ACRDRU_29640 [Pseudonocardiaceae bacterium]